MEISRSILRRMPEQSLTDVFRDGSLYLYGGESQDIDNPMNYEPIAEIYPVNFQAPEFGKVAKTFDPWEARILHHDVVAWFRLYSKGDHKNSPRVWMQGTAGPGGGFLRDYDMYMHSVSLRRGDNVYIDAFTLARETKPKRRVKKTSALDTELWRSEFKAQINTRDMVHREKEKSFMRSMAGYAKTATAITKIFEDPSTRMCPHLHKNTTVCPYVRGQPDSLTTQNLNALQKQLSVLTEMVANIHKFNT